MDAPVGAIELKVAKSVNFEDAIEGVVAPTTCKGHKDAWFSACDTHDLRQRPKGNEWQKLRCPSSGLLCRGYAEATKEALEDTARQMLSNPFSRQTMQMEFRTFERLLLAMPFSPSVHHDSQKREDSARSSTTKGKRTARGRDGTHKGYERSIRVYRDISV